MYKMFKCTIFCIYYILNNIIDMIKRIIFFRLLLRSQYCHTDKFLDIDSYC